MDLLIKSGAGTAEAWVARPDGGDTERPEVLLFVDASGLRPRSREIVDCIAS